MARVRSSEEGFNFMKTDLRIHLIFKSSQTDFADEGSSLEN
jgi:hypothetical protein